MGINIKNSYKKYFDDLKIILTKILKYLKI